VHYGHFDFIILVVEILSMHAINFGVVSLFVDSTFTFFSSVEYVIVIKILYQFE